MSNFDRPLSGPNQPQVVYVAAPPPPRSFVSRLFGIAWTLLSLFFMLAVLVAIFSPESLGDPASRVEERFYSGNPQGPHKVAVITIDGTILDAEPIRRQCEHAAQDEALKAIVLRVDSPGGTVTASDQMYQYLRKLATERRLPLVVSMGGLAASGGYYVSMACGDAENVIYAEPTTWTGSIGVIIPHYDLSGLLARFDVEEDSIKSAPLKSLGSITKKMTPEERDVLQKLVDDSFQRFKDIVTAGRPKLRGDDESLRKATTGQVFTLKQALALGLVDREGFLDDAVARALELAGVPAGETAVVEYHRPKSLTETLVGANARSSQSELRALLDLATPRAFYLYAWPGLGREE